MKALARIITAWLGAGAIALGAAAEERQPQSLQQLLEFVQQGQAVDAREAREREARFLADGVGVGAGLGQERHGLLAGRTVAGEGLALHLLDLRGDVLAYDPRPLFGVGDASGGALGLGRGLGLGGGADPLTLLRGSLFGRRGIGFGGSQEGAGAGDLVLSLGRRLSERRPGLVLKGGPQQFDVVAHLADVSLFGRPGGVVQGFRLGPGAGLKFGHCRLGPRELRLCLADDPLVLFFGPVSYTHLTLPTSDLV